MPHRERGSSLCLRSLHSKFNHSEGCSWQMMCFHHSLLCLSFQLNPVLIPHPQQRGACTKQEWRDQRLKEHNQCSKQRGRIRGLISELYLAILTQNCNNANKTFPRIKSAGFGAHLERPALPGPSDWRPSKGFFVLVCFFVVWLFGWLFFYIDTLNGEARPTWDWRQEYWGVPLTDVCPHLTSCWSPIPISVLCSNCF